jgi:hypothetical protein
LRSGITLGTLVAIGALRTIRSLHSNRALRTLSSRITLGTLVTIGALRAIRPLRSHHALRTLCPGITLGALVAIGALRTIRSLHSNRALRTLSSRITLGTLIAIGALRTIRSLRSHRTLSALNSTWITLGNLAGWRGKAQQRRIQWCAAHAGNINFTGIEHPETLIQTLVPDDKSAAWCRCYLNIAGETGH